VAAVAQGITIGALSEAAIAEGIKAHQIWTWAVLAPQDYFVAPDVKTFADLKGKRLSAAGGIGALNWQMGREVLRRANLTVNDVQWISQGMAGRLPGLVTGQLDGVVLHAEDAWLAPQRKPGTHSLISIAELLPNWVYGTYGAADALVARDRDLVRDTIASLIEANRAIYTQRDKVIPIMVEATKKPLNSVEYAWDFLTKRCIWSVNTGFDKARSDWTMQYWIDVGDVPAAKKLAFEQMDDVKLANDALAAAGGPTTINSCKY
jgi:ABC-type nitrate/sulfonate/bicarbonate transport system substrate-binding protein